MNKDFDVGFLKPDGTLIVCDSYEHLDKAFDICKELEIPCNNRMDAEQELFKLGWIEIRSRDIMSRIGVFIRDSDGNFTGRQYHLTNEQKKYLTDHYEDYNDGLRQSIDELIDKLDK